MLTLADGPHGQPRAHRTCNLSHSPARSVSTGVLRPGIGTSPESPSAGDRSMKLSVRSLVSSVACVGVGRSSSLVQRSLRAIRRWASGSSTSRSRRSARGPAPKSGNTTIEAAGTGTKVVVDQVTGRWHQETLGIHRELRREGQPRHRGTPTSDTVARTRINPTTVQTISKKGGKVIDHSDVCRVE